MKYSFIRQNSSAFPIRSMCQALGVSKAGYYAWFDREPSAADQRREELAEEIRTAHADVKRRYGSPLACLNVG
jgi:putative transposase